MAWMTSGAHPNNEIAARVERALPQFGQLVLVLALQYAPARKCAIVSPSCPTMMDACSRQDPWRRLPWHHRSAVHAQPRGSPVKLMESILETFALYLLRAAG